jgi:putative intracellular protease/amidase
MANEGIEEVELTEPLKAVEEAGAEAEILAPEAGDIQAFNHLDKAKTFTARRAVGDAKIDEFDGLVLPGGVANPEPPHPRGGCRLRPRLLRFPQASRQSVLLAFARQGGASSPEARKLRNKTGGRPCLFFS